MRAPDRDDADSQAIGWFMPRCADCMVTSPGFGYEQEAYHGEGMVLV